MNKFKYPVQTHVKFKPGITVIKQLQINDYDTDQYFYGLVDDQGSEIVPCECQYFKPIGDGLIVTESKHGIFGILDQAGTYVVPFSRGYQSVSRFLEGRALVRESQLPLRYGFIDSFWNEVIPLQYAEAGFFLDGIAAVRNFDGKWGFIDRTGKQLTPFNYDGIISIYSSDAALVIINGDFVMINMEGEELFRYTQDVVLKSLSELRNAK